MVHIPSFLVGSLCSGGAFLWVHRELSFRSRLTYRWTLVEKTEEEFQKVLQKAKEHRKEKSLQSSQQSSPSSNAVKESWNDGVMTVQEYAAKAMFGVDKDQ